MIIVRLMGGLGNQMFQYAAALRLAMKHRTKLKLDCTFLMDRTPRKHFTYRDFDLGIFGFPVEPAIPMEVRRFRRLIERNTRTLSERIADRFVRRTAFLEKGPFFDHRILQLPDETYLEGYFQDERYFADIGPAVRERFRVAPDEATLPVDTRRLATQIQAANSVCIHVRRGDYASDPVIGSVHGLCRPDYYERGLAEVRKRSRAGPIFVFSDDEIWCRSHFAGIPDTTVVGREHAGPKASTHLWLMTLCRHFIIANSSFSWWAAWLSDSANKVVVRPTPWFQSPIYQQADICPPAWITVPNS
jgi:hypothetical protein